MANHYHIRGISLLECIITLAIAATLMTAVIPSFRSVIANTQIQTSADKLIRTTLLARTESVKRGQRVIVCFSDTDTACNSASPERILVFADSDRSGYPTSTTDIIQDIELTETAISITYNRPFLAYAPTGYAAGTNGTFKICHASGIGHMVVVSALGRPRKAIDYDGDGIVEKSPGHPLTC